MAEEQIRQLNEQLTAARAKVDALETKDIGSSYAAVLLRRHCGLDDTKEDLMEVAELVALLRADLTATRAEVERWCAIAEGLATALERLDGLYMSEQEPDAPQILPEWIREPLERFCREKGQP